MTKLIHTSERLTGAGAISKSRSIYGISKTFGVSGSQRHQISINSIKRIIFLISVLSEKKCNVRVKHKCKFLDLQTVWCFVITATLAKHMWHKTYNFYNVNFKIIIKFQNYQNIIRLLRCVSNRSHHADSGTPKH